MPADAAPLLTVYSRGYCHLCDDMIAGLRRLQAVHHFELAIVDIEDDALLEERYGERVPVLAFEGRELCQYFLDSAAVSDVLAQFR